MLSRVRFYLIISAMVSSWLLPTASANVGEAFGIGSRNAGLGGAANVSGAFDAFSAYRNPAALALSTNSKFMAGWALVDMEPRFLAINNIVLENNYTSNLEEPRYGNVDNNYRHTLGETFGLAYQITEDPHRYSIGAVMYLPLERLTFIDTGEILVPEYVLYRDRTQRPQIDMSFGGQILPGFYFGAGIEWLFEMDATGFLSLQGPDVGSAERNILRR